MHTDYIIIGAGLTGLSLALFLKDKGYGVAVVEKSGRAGGQMHTVRDEGFVFESGPNTGVVGNEAVLRLFAILGDDCPLREANRRAAVRQVLYKGRPTDLPSGLLSSVMTPLFTWRDKLRFLGEPFRARGKDPLETVADMVRRRLGCSFYDYAVDPFISGIYAGNPERLVTRFALPRLYRLERDYGSFVRGAIKRSKAIAAERARGVSRSIFSVDGGFSSLVDAIVSRVGEESIFLSADYELQKLSDNKWKVSFADASLPSLKASTVISTVPAHALEALLPFVSKADLAPISRMEYAPVIEVGVGLADGSRIPKAFGLLVPSVEGEDVLGILYNSSTHEGRAPEGGASLSVFLGGMRRPEMLDLPDAEIAAIVSEALSRYFDYPEGIMPDKMYIFRHRRAIPQYEADTEARLRAISEIQMRHEGLILAGGICDGIGVADRIAQADRIARVLDDRRGEGK